MDFDKRLDCEKTKVNIVMMLVNSEKNVELLKSVPNRQFHDLSIIYCLPRNLISHEIITNSMAEELDIEEDELYELSYWNTLRLFPPSIKPLHNVIEELAHKIGQPLERDKFSMKKGKMYVISNERGHKGAIYMAYDEVIYRLAEKLDTDLYILPSSIHEVLAVSTSGTDAVYLAQIVNEVNTEFVDPEYQLSNKVYYYDRNLRKLSIASH